MRVEHLEELRIDVDTARVAGRVPPWVIPAVKVVLVSIDALIAAASFTGAFWLREGVKPVLAGAGWSLHSEFEPYAALLLFVLPIRLMAFAYYDLYRLRGEFSYLDDWVRVFKATAVGSLLIVAAAFL